MIKCTLNPRREFTYPILVVHDHGNVWLMTGPTSGTLLKTHANESRPVGYHTDNLLSIESETKGWGEPLKGSITLSNK